MNDGVSFEAKVERWLRRSCGAGFTERRARVQGKHLQHGHEVDVHATIVNDFYKVLAGLAMAGMAVAIVAGLAKEEVIAVFSLLPSLGAGVFAAVMAADPRHVWVECKSGEGTVRRDVVWKLVGQVQDVRDLYGNAPATWYPHDVWLVVRSRFDSDALRLAREHGVRCFVEQAGDIREVI